MTGVAVVVAGVVDVVVVAVVAAVAVVVLGRLGCWSWRIQAAGSVSLLGQTAPPRDKRRW